MNPRRLALIRSGEAGEGRITIGSGYLVAPRLVLTARHVLENRDTGEFWPHVSVHVGHHREGGTTRVAAEPLWSHPDGLDVALLRIDREINLSGSVRWGRPAGTAPLPYVGLGYPWAAKGETREPEYLRGVLPLLSGGRDRYVLDQGPAPAPRSGGGNAWGGASGAAIFCDGHLVGVVTQEDLAYGARRLIALPVLSFAGDGGFVSHIEEETDEPPEVSAIGASLPLAGPQAGRTLAERELERLLGPLFPYPGTRMDQARALARELGYDSEGYEPSAADLVALLMAHPRALASLGEIVASSAQGAVRDALTELFARARTFECATLLSVNEYEDLLGLLRPVCEKRPALLPQAAREAFRHLVLPEILTRPQLSEDDLGGVIEGLEELADSEGVPQGTPPVPALLRLVEYVAAAVEDGLGGALRAWSETTAGRLGIHAGALGERRADAARWAKRPSSPVSRVVMELEHEDIDGDDRYRSRILLVRDDGSYRVLEAKSVPKTPREVASSLREAVFAVGQEAGQGDQVPWVTVVVDRDRLHMAVDEWVPGEPDGILPVWPIGADYQVSLSCPELNAQFRDRESAQDRRWKNGRASVLVTGPECGEGSRLVYLLKNTHRDTARVVLHGPADERRSSLLVCLALGVPVVLWDRDAIGYEDAGRLENLAPDDDLEGLPERVRDFRGGSVTCPEQGRAQPSLVWEPEDRLPRAESLRLTDPSRGTCAS